MRRLRGASFLIVIMLAVFAVSVSAQDNNAGVAISSPASGTVIQPGRSLTITVSTANPDLLKAIEVGGEDPIGLGSLQAPSSSNSFTLQVPTNIRPGNYQITAVGYQLDHGRSSSAPITVTVPLSSPVTSIRVDRVMAFRFVGEQQTIYVLAETAHGNLFPDTTALTFSSSDTTVATVDAQGQITAVSPGTAQVTVNYQNISSPIKVIVPASAVGAVTPAPTFSPSGGLFATTQTVSLTDSMPATIFFTTDGSTPTIGSAVYFSPINVNDTQTIKAIAVASGYAASAVASATYVMGNSGANFAP